ncbi:MAG: 50S ribosomal protein L6 [OCS116 cluster bacterium]|uniref:Large ribosomal subunit protein uL6 n=1 Tax=OCS116 cluster bacterium TaxID=2030921 RepID=A0A2A4Z7F5_9PROT|nr:50S ribosomal protein L6 [OCS116 cluster bacterium]
MSRIGKKAVPLPAGVEFNIDGQEITVKGPKGSLSVVLVSEVSVSKTEAGLLITPSDDSKRARSMWGMSRTLVANIVTGVSEGYSKTLEIRGVGYRAALKGKILSLNLGLSHEVNYEAPEGVELKVTKPTEIVVSGIDKQLVGQVAANIRKYRKPEPFKGKGIRYQGEYVFRKEGKKK